MKICAEYEKIVFQCPQRLEPTKPQHFAEVLLCSENSLCAGARTGKLYKVSTFSPEQLRNDRFLNA